MKKFLLTVLLLVVPFAVSAQYQNYEGVFFSGEENLSLELIEADIPWSTGDLVGEMILEACVSGDGATVVLTREEIVITYSGAIMPISGTQVFNWYPAAHAYVYESNISNQGKRDVSILVFSNDTVTLIDGDVQYYEYGFELLDINKWKWLHTIPMKIELGEDYLR